MAPRDCKRVRRELLAECSGSKSSLAGILKKLHDESFLDTDMGGGSVRMLRKNLQVASEFYSKASTMYGTLVQTIDLGTPSLSKWEYVHPAAYLRLLSEISPGFSAMMAETVASIGHRPLKLVLYMDECTPGNPLRADKARSVQSIYWCFADWPQWALQKSSVWLLLGCMRSSLQAELPEGASTLLHAVLRMFFPSCSAIGNQNRSDFRHGIFLKNGTTGSDTYVTAAFAGMIGDLKAHCEVWCCKTAGASKPCMSCKNVVTVDFLNRRLSSEYLVDLKCGDMRRFDATTDDEVYAITDRLINAGIDNDTKRKELEQRLGFKTAPHGLLADHAVREIVRPIKHFLRDWMHMLVSHGVAGTEMALVIAALRQKGTTYEDLQRYAIGFRMPKALGKISKTWFSKGMVNKDSLKTFAGEQLSMLPVLMAYMTDIASKFEDLADHTRCLQLLTDIVGICALGPHDAMQHLNLMQAKCEQHHALFVIVYKGKGVKPKLHHLLHLVEDARDVGCMMSCFAMERKHRVVKKASLFAFRNFEHTITADLVNKQVQ